MPPVIRVEGLGKRYRLGVRGEAPTTLRQGLGHAARRGAAFLAGRGRPAGHIWALDDATFDVDQGEVVGIVGRNGAGKSTLLKLLARITAPTKGRALLRGRLGSLLEVGTGFHPELTGRDNVFLSGAILGMRRHEILSRFDEIAAFAEIDAFLDTPVKRYSSGMYLRLAFAVAAYLPTDILLVDEVLAVGDWAFQKKCLGAMKDTVRGGRTVLFVSHNMTAVNALCNRAVLVDRGRVQRVGPTEEVSAAYLSGQPGAGSPSATGGVFINRQVIERDAREEFRYRNIEVWNASHPGAPPASGDGLRIRLTYESSAGVQAPAFTVVIKDVFGARLFDFSSTPISGFEIPALGRSGSAELLVPSLPLGAGRYYIDVGLVRRRAEWLTKLEEVASIDVEPSDVYGSGFAVTYSVSPVLAPHSWTHTPDGPTS
jgi:lipopolysaccharide transport system ATP-binding protein